MFMNELYTVFIAAQDKKYESKVVGDVENSKRIYPTIW
jgi:hypothetical protein